MQEEEKKIICSQEARENDAFTVCFIFGTKEI